jgi:hypothetical protein
VVYLPENSCNDKYSRLPDLKIGEREKGKGKN